MDGKGGDAKIFPVASETPRCGLEGHGVFKGVKKRRKIQEEGRGEEVDIGK
jgi:hypothetical protein